MQEFIMHSPYLQPARELPVNPLGKYSETGRGVIPAEKREKNFTNVAVYARVSTLHPEQEGSLKAQEAHYRTLIAAHPGWSLVDIYSDTVSGTNMARPGLKALMAACDKGGVNVILTKSISRFARNITDCLVLVRRLKALGVTIRFEKENLDTGTAESEFMLSIMGAIAEEESRSISQNIKWGLQRRFHSGTYKAPRAPYGYQLQGFDFTVDPNTAPIVRRIFRAIASGASAYRTAKELNQDSISTPRKASAWSPETVRMIVRNRTYLGDRLLQKTYKDEKYRQRVNDGKLDQYLYEDHHEPLVSKDLWNRANACLDQAKTTRKTGAIRSCFSGKIICGNCGGKMYRTRNHYVESPLYTCHTKVRRPGKCNMRSVDENKLKAAFLTLLNKLKWAQGRGSVLNLIDCSGSQVSTLRKTVSGWTVTDDLTAFDPDTFRAIIDHVTACRDRYIRFHMKCGLALVERLPWKLYIPTAFDLVGNAGKAAGQYYLIRVPRTTRPHARVLPLYCKCCGLPLERHRNSVYYHPLCSLTPVNGAAIQRGFSSARNKLERRGEARETDLPAVRRNITGKAGACDSAVFDRLVRFVTVTPETIDYHFKSGYVITVPYQKNVSINFQ